MGKKWVNAVRCMLIALAVVGAIGYGISTWKIIRNDGSKGAVEDFWSTEAQPEEGRDAEEKLLKEANAKSGQENNDEDEADTEADTRPYKAEDDGLDQEAEKSLFTYVDEATAVPGLPNVTTKQIERINRGELLAEVTGINGLENYYALIGTKGIVARDKETEEIVDGGGEVTLYVPNLIAGLKDVSVLFYGKDSGRWEVIPVPEEFVEPEVKMVTLDLPGAGILTVIYRRE